MDSETREAVKEIVTNVIYKEMVNFIGWDYTNYLTDSIRLECVYKQSKKSGKLIELKDQETNTVLMEFEPERLVNLYIWYLTRIVENTDLREGFYTELVCTITRFKDLLNTGGNSYGSN